MIVGPRRLVVINMTVDKGGTSAATLHNPSADRRMTISIAALGGPADAKVIPLESPMPQSNPLPESEGTPSSVAGNG